jgi:AcrR family transcriptional regulator
MTDLDLGGSRGRRLQVRTPRGARKAKPRRNGFTDKRKELFLSHFAATCNAKASARAAGVANTTVYQHRKSDAAFREAWNEALDQGYARLEAELVRRAALVPRVRADEKSARANSAIDPKVGLAILESYRRNGNRRPGEILVQPYDPNEVARRLEAKMRMLGLLGEREAAAAADEKAESDVGAILPLPRD